MEQREVERFRTYFGGRNYKIASRLHLGDERRQLRVIYQVYDLSNQVADDLSGEQREEQICRARKKQEFCFRHIIPYIHK